ncbi:MAG TPA: hypothetical protein PK370_01595 [Candidatus Woesebacteria bacterium]|nr:hypothetical protein [Candidatus Woesebacteria bacterium]HPJ17093.1 hypothetical protein [Candidatus Woesebacteria bacterium]
MFKKIRFRLEYYLRYLKKKYPFFLLGILLGYFVFTQQKNIFKIGQSILISTSYYGIEGLYNQQNLPLEITSLISYGLTSVDQNGKISTSPIVSDMKRLDDTTYIFKIANNHSWHSGKNLEATDIDPKIADVDITTNQDEITFKLKKPLSSFLSILSKPLFYKKTLRGLGEYKVTNIQYQDGYISTLTLYSSSLKKRQVYRFYHNQSDLINAFKLGLVDNISVSENPNDFDQWSNVKITPQVDQNKYIAIFINNQKYSVKQLRQALNYATPKTTDKNERCLGPISPSSFAYNSKIKDYSYSPLRAKELFDKNKIENISITVTDRKLLPQADEIKTAWEKNLSIKVSLNLVNNSSFADFDTILAYANIPNDPDQYIYWHSTQTNTNLTKLNNSRIDKLLEEGRQTTDQIERKKIYQDFQRFLLEESPAIFIKYPITYQISRV